MAADPFDPTGNAPPAMGGDSGLGLTFGRGLVRTGATSAIRSIRAETVVNRLPHTRNA